jgi:hypothetical protein
MGIGLAAMGVGSNFDCLAVQDERLVRLGAPAEGYFFDDDCWLVVVEGGGAVGCGSQEL